MKIGFNCSSFDLLHAGHVTMLKMEKQLCDYLIVALQVDPTIDRPGEGDVAVGRGQAQAVRLNFSILSKRLLRKSQTSQNDSNGNAFTRERNVSFH